MTMYPRAWGSWPIISRPSRQGYSTVSKWGFPDRTLVLVPNNRPRRYRPRIGPNRSQWERAK